MKSFRKYVGAGINPVVLAFPIVPDFWSFWIYGNYSFPVIPAFKSAVLRIRGFYPRYRILFFLIPDSGLTRFRDSAGAPVKLYISIFLEGPSAISDSHPSPKTSLFHHSLPHHVYLLSIAHPNLKKGGNALNSSVRIAY
jgi:hypothetical protein